MRNRSINRKQLDVHFSPMLIITRRIAFLDNNKMFIRNFIWMLKTKEISRIQLSELETIPKNMNAHSNLRFQLRRKVTIFLSLWGIDCIETLWIECRIISYNKLNSKLKNQGNVHSHQMLMIRNIDRIKWFMKDCII